jgi:hypothetical protein
MIEQVSKSNKEETWNLGYKIKQKEVFVLKLPNFIPYIPPFSKPLSAKEYGQTLLNKHRCHSKI